MFSRLLDAQSQENNGDLCRSIRKGIEMHPIWGICCNANEMDHAPVRVWQPRDATYVAIDASARSKILRRELGIVMT
jgi:hypothetical protein